MAHDPECDRSALSRPLLTLGLVLLTLVLVPGCSLLTLPFRIVGSLLSLVVNNVSKVAMLVVRVPVEETEETEVWLRDRGLEATPDVAESLLALSASSRPQEVGGAEELLRRLVERAATRGRAAELVVFRAEPGALLSLRSIDVADPSRKSIIFVLPLAAGEEPARDRIRSVEALARAGMRIDDRTRETASAGLSGVSHAAP